MSNSTLLLVVGTRPEAVKMAPVVRALRRRWVGDVVLCATAQHRQMLDDTLADFNLSPDIDLDLMKPGQGLSELTARLHTGVAEVLDDVRPAAVLVHGDTTTCLAAGLAAFYAQAPIGHVEAGLRTHDLTAPWPEEMNRRLVDPLCQWCFAPTEGARLNLLAEGIDEDRIHITGNTAVDALNVALEAIERTPPEVAGFDPERRFVLVTGHRRESFGAGLRELCLALREIADAEGDVDIVYPVHLNPKVQDPVHELLADHASIHLLAPQPYLAFVQLMRQCRLIVTDSGGIQEEAPSLGKPVLVTRASTERPEAVEAGLAKLVGVDRKRIVGEALRLLRDEDAYVEMTGEENPFGDGRAAERIVDVLAEALNKETGEPRA